MFSLILCAFGCHSWEYIGTSGLVFPMPIMRCKRCGCGECYSVTGYRWTWTREELAAEIKKNAIKPH